MTKEEFLIKLTEWYDYLRCGDCLHCLYYFYWCGHNLVRYILEEKFNAKLVKKEKATEEFKFANYLQYEIDNLIVNLTPTGFSVEEKK